MSDHAPSPQLKGAGWTGVNLALQTLLVVAVVGWVLDLPRGWFGVALYTEQFLVTVIGFALALAYLTVPANPRFAGRTPWWDVAAAALGLALCLYTAWRYPALSNELTSRPLEGVLMAAALAGLVLEATRRTAGSSLVFVVLAGVVYTMFETICPECSSRARSNSRGCSSIWAWTPTRSWAVRS